MIYHKYLSGKLIICVYGKKNDRYYIKLDDGNGKLVTLLTTTSLGKAVCVTNALESFIDMLLMQQKFQYTDEIDELRTKLAEGKENAQTSNKIDP